MYLILTFFLHLGVTRYGNWLSITEDMQGYSVWTALAFNYIEGVRYEVTEDVEIRVGKKFV